MAVSSPSAPALLDLPLEVLTGVCEQLDFRDLIRVAATCKRFRHGDGGLETLELPTKSPVVTALREHAFPGGVGIPSTRPVGWLESWIAYLARSARQRRCREALPIAAGNEHTLFVDAAGRLLACGKGAAVGHGDEAVRHFYPTPVTALAGIRVRSVAAGPEHRLALGWDRRVYSWGLNFCGELGRRDDRPSPALVDGLEGVRGIAVSEKRSLAVTSSGAVFHWGAPLRSRAKDALQPVIVRGFGGVLVRHVSSGFQVAFAIGRDGELFSWGCSMVGLLGHGDTRHQSSPKRVEALRGVRVCCVSVGLWHALALAEDGLVYAWGWNRERALLGNPHVEGEPLSKPVEALRGVRVGGIAAGCQHSYAVSDTGELWAWGVESKFDSSRDHGEQVNCPLPKPIESLRGIKVDAVAACDHTLALVDDGSVYGWGDMMAGARGALGLGASASNAGVPVSTPQRVPELRVACGL
jgi:alpha-tubulin suppressor-like RCC1 family protein